MPGKLNNPRLTVFLLAIGLGSACSGAEPLRFPSMAERLNAQWQEQILNNLVHEKRIEPLGDCVGTKVVLGRYGFPFFCGGGAQLILPSPKYVFQNPLSPFINAIITCSKVKITSTETSLILPPDLAGVLYDQLIEGYRILNRTETTETTAAVHCFNLLISILTPDENSWIEPGDSLEKEIQGYRPSNIPPSIVMEFDGENWLQVEVFLDARCAVVRTKDKWGGYTFTTPGAKYLEASINDLHAIYANQAPEK